MTGRARILLADRDKLMLDILRDLLKSRYEIVGDVEDGLALIRVAQELKPDIIVCDITMPPLTGLEAMSLIKKDLPEVKFVFLTNHAEPGYLTEAMHLGAAGIVLNKSGSSHLLTAIAEIVEGHRQVA